MLWFALGLMLGGFLGMLLMGIFALKKRSEGIYGDDMGGPDEETFRKVYRRPDENSRENRNSNPLG